MQLLWLYVPVFFYPQKLNITYCCRSPPFLKFGFPKFSEMEATAMAVKPKYYIKIHKELVEVTQDVYLEYYRAARREQAQKEKERKHRVLSYDALDAEGRLGSELLSHSVNIEDQVSARLMCEKLHRSLRKWKRPRSRKRRKTYELPPIAVYPPTVKSSSTATKTRKPIIQKKS